MSSLEVNSPVTFLNHQKKKPSEKQENAAIL